MHPVVLPYQKAFAEYQKRKKTYGDYYKHELTKINAGQWQVSTVLDLDAFYSPMAGIGIRNTTIKSVRPSGDPISATMINSTSNGVLPFLKGWQSIINNSRYGKLGDKP